MKASVISLALALTYIAPVSGQSRAGTDTKPVTKTPYILQVRARQVDDHTAKQSATAGDIVLLLVSNPVEFVNQRPNDNSRMVLYAGGVRLAGITSDLLNKVRKEDFKTDDSIMWIPFTLKKDTSTKAAWDYLYTLKNSWNQTKVNVNLTMAWEGNLPVRVRPKDLGQTAIEITCYDSGLLYFMMFIYLIIVIGLIALGAYTDILKEGDTGAYSLAQTQLAFWTILVLGAFLYSLALTNIPSTLNSSILTLLGISISTSGFSGYIDYFQKRRSPGTFSPKKHLGFWRDILGDGASMNMQRFQIVAWNIVLGLYFTFYTVNNKTMPVIPEVLLTLAGISSITYLTGKPLEQPAPANKETPAPNTPVNQPAPASNNPTP